MYSECYLTSSKFSVIALRNVMTTLVISGQFGVKEIVVCNIATAKHIRRPKLKTLQECSLHY